MNTTILARRTLLHNLSCIKLRPAAVFSSPHIYRRCNNVYISPTLYKSPHHHFSLWSFFRKNKEEQEEKVPVYNYKATTPSNEIKMMDRYRACMVLAGVGDALGYNNSEWEFLRNGPSMIKEFEQIKGGLEKIDIAQMMVSDDQVMHLATAEALLGNHATFNALMEDIARSYVASFTNMAGRSPGPMTAVSIAKLESGIKYDKIYYSERGGGCGGSMRSMCIGLRYCGEDQRDNLISVAIDSGRMTHNHPTGFLGALASALFTAYAIEGVPKILWGRKLVKEILPKAYSYLEKTQRNWDDYQPDLKDFENFWNKYLNKREIMEGDKPVFPTPFGPKERDEFYTWISFSGWGGASGHDSVIIAYDALLGAENDFLELVKRGVLHGGDNDSTGTIACAWWGALHSFEGVPERIWKNVEYRKKADIFGQEIYKIVKREKNMKHF